MGVVDVDKIEVTLLKTGSRRVERFNGDVADALTFSKLCRVTLSDGTEYYAQLRLIPQEFIPTTDAHVVDFDTVFIESYTVADDGKGAIVHEKRGHI